MLARVMRVTFFPLPQRIKQWGGEEQAVKEECRYIYLTMTSYLGVYVCIRPPERDEIHVVSATAMKVKKKKNVSTHAQNKRCIYQV